MNIQNGMEWIITTVGQLKICFYSKYKTVIEKFCYSVHRFFIAYDNLKIKKKLWFLFSYQVQI